MVRFTNSLIRIMAFKSSLACLDVVIEHIHLILLKLLICYGSSQALKVEVVLRGKIKFCLVDGLKKISA